MRSVAAFAAGFGCQLMILRKAALARAYALAAFATGLRGKAWILRKAALFMRHALAALAGNRALFLGVHRREASGRCLVSCIRRIGH